MGANLRESGFHVWGEGRCTDLGGLLFLSLGSWNEGVGETGEESNVRTVYCEQVKLALLSSFRVPRVCATNPALSLQPLALLYLVSPDHVDYEALAY